jgi:hypothetical protein
MDLNVPIIIGIFFVLLFLGVWITAEYNTMAVKKRIAQHEAHARQLAGEVSQQKVLLKQEMDKVMDLQADRRELARIKKDLLHLKDKHNLLSEEHTIFLQIVRDLKKKCQRTEFNGSHLSRLVVADIDKMLEVEKELAEKKVKVVDKDTEKMFNRIKDKLAPNG